MQYIVALYKRYPYSYITYYLLTEAVRGIIRPSTDDVAIWHSSIPDLLSYWNRKLYGMECGRVDHTNFRLLLWKCVTSLIPNIAEARSRILVPLVLRFIK